MRRATVANRLEGTYKDKGGTQIQTRYDEIKQNLVAGANTLEGTYEEKVLGTDAFHAQQFHWCGVGTQTMCFGSLGGAGVH